MKSCRMCMKDSTRSLMPCSRGILDERHSLERARCCYLVSDMFIQNTVWTVSYLTISVAVAINLTNMTADGCF